MPHKVEFHPSFRDHLGQLTEAAQREVGAIVKALELDYSFCPGGAGYEDYQIESDVSGLHACSHAEVWGNWQLIWYSQVIWSNSHVDKVVIRLEPFELLPIKPLGSSL